ncbi:MAG: nucleotide exchange factor GrpE [Patescibacteria group bacterium]|jgi:molecular chaperone GrpE
MDTHHEQKKDKHRRELDEIKMKAEEYLSGWKRAQADYQNLQKQSEKEKLEIGSFARSAVLVQMLPILENLRRAFHHVPDEQKKAEWVVGLQHIQTQMEELLTQYQLTEIDAEGKQFDPHLHEAVAREKRDGVESDVILEVLQSGWKYGERVLVPSKVKVAE